MVTIEPQYAHIAVNERGVPIIAGTRLKVKLLIEIKLARGYSPEELQEQYPFLTLGQIHSALAYYYDHQEQLDREIAQDLQAYEQMGQASGQPQLSPNSS